MADLKLHDAVSITTQSPPLEGIILHYGTVSFAAGTWIGLRLTGSSVGKGKNDGTVEGVSYFTAPEKGGLFMKEIKAKEGGLKKRELSKLEELRLKREVGLKSDSTSAAARTPIKTRSRASGDSSTASSNSGEDKGSDRRRELRARREALEKERKGISTKKEGEEKTTSVERSQRDGNDETNKAQELKVDEMEEEDKEQPKVNLSHATAGYKAELARLQGIITNLKSDLVKKETENASLQSSLDFMSKGAEQSTHDAVRMYALGALALSEKKSPSGKTRTSTPGASSIMGEPKTSGEESMRSLKDELANEESESDGNESDGEGDGSEQVVNQAAAAVSQALVDRNNELMSQLSEIASTKSKLEHELSESQERIDNMTNKLQALVVKLENEKQSRAEEKQGFIAEKSTLTSQLTSLQREYSIMEERITDKSENVSAVSLAKLKAEISTLQRKNTELEEEKMDTEATLEELVLDKESLKEENEMMIDQLEEMKIDLESTMLELEDVKGQLSSNASVDTETIGEGTDAVDGSDSDAARSLSLQNARLRTAILRLREQSEQEKNELQRQLKVLQSDFTSKEALQAEFDELQSVHARTVSEVQELKDIVDQTSSLEEMIETLSDKVWTLEQKNANLERTIRELEESAEIAAEMEEVQSDELKAVMRDLEGRDALILNLEEAIRMQRRREEDFQRYVSDFRSSISTLKQEKATLLALTEGDQGEKSQLKATSQKALVQAAQLAADASAARNRDSDAVFDRITARSASYMCQRLESLLPSGVVSTELAAIKGEIDLSKLADMAAVSLSTLEEMFNKTIEMGVSGLSEFNVVEEGSDVAISDSSTQQIDVMIHQVEFASIVIESASDALRFLAAGQWPELMSEELSTELGNVVVHSITQALSEQLKLLKQEGVLSPLRSSLSELHQSAQNTKLALFDTRDNLGNPIIPVDWNPPGLKALKSLSMGRFTCMGTTAVLASAICPIGDSEEPPAPTLANFAGFLEQAKQSCSNMTDICRKLSGLDLNDAEIIASLNQVSFKYESSSLALFNCVKETFTQQSVATPDVDKCSTLLEDVVANVRHLSALLRKANLGDDFITDNFHELSPEFEDSWGGLTNAAAQMRAIDGDSEDINYLMRARTLVQHLSDAVQNQPLLEKSNAKITSLEKSLASRSKEIAMQNSRIAELESLITKKSSSSFMSPVKGVHAPSTPSADTHKLKEEVHMLQEALDVMQQQADEYEKEIKSLKDKSRTPRVARQTSGRITPQKQSSSLDLDLFGSATKPGGASSRDIMLESISLETALFRPALASATQSASYWKAQSMGSALSKLPPLNVRLKSHQVKGFAQEVILARNEVRLAKASVSIVDLSKNDISPRNQLNEQKQKELTAESRLHDATLSWMNEQSLQEKSSVPKQTTQTKELLGKIVVPCKQDTGFVTHMNVSKAELRNFHSFLVQ